MVLTAQSFNKGVGAAQRECQGVALNISSHTSTLLGFHVLHLCVTVSEMRPRAGVPAMSLHFGQALER